MDGMDGTGGDRTGPVLVIGEALVDIVSDTEGRTLETRPGGAPLNVAVGLSRLGVPTILLTSFGQDEHGSAIAEHLEASGVRLASPQRTEKPTSVAHASLDRAGSATYRFDLSWEPAEVPVPREVTAVHVGSLGTVLEPGAGRTRQIVQQARETGTVVTYDPNVRPAISEDARLAWTQVQEWAALADVVKLSDDDAAFLQPEAPVDAVIETFLAAPRTRLVVVTQGAGGTTLATREHRVHVDTPRVEVVDTVGAGDSFMSAVIAALAERELSSPESIGRLTRQRLHDIGTWAATAAAVTCSRRGADPPHRLEVESAQPADV
jgi:fructokinase